MGNIYSNAKSCLAWLGSDIHDEEFLFRQLNADPFARALAQDSSQESALELDEQTERTTRAIWYLSGNQYWGRLCIVQENLLPKQVSFHGKNACVKKAVLNTWISAMTEWKGTEIFTAMEDVVAWFEEPMYLLSDRGMTSRPRLSNLLWDLTSLPASLKHDSIYALLGAGGPSSGKSPIIVDYSISRSKLLIETTPHLGYSNSLELIGRIMSNLVIHPAGLFEAITTDDPVTTLELEAQKHGEMEVLTPWITVGLFRGVSYRTKESVLYGLGPRYIGNRSGYFHLYSESADDKQVRALDYSFLPKRYWHPWSIVAEDMEDIYLTWFERLFRRSRFSIEGNTLHITSRTSIFLCLAVAEGLTRVLETLSYEKKTPSGRKLVKYFQQYKHEFLDFLRDLPEPKPLPAELL